MKNPFSNVGAGVPPERYDLADFQNDLEEIVRIFERAMSNATEPGETNEDESVSPETLAAQRRQAMGAATKRLSRGVALRFILDCRQCGYPMSVHLARRLVGELFQDYGRKGIAETVLVEVAGGGPGARANPKLDLDAECEDIIASGLLQKHQKVLQQTRVKANKIRARMRPRSSA